jgi:hypothetical protein
MGTQNKKDDVNRNKELNISGTIAKHDQVDSSPASPSSLIPPTPPPASQTQVTTQCGNMGASGSGLFDVSGTIEVNEYVEDSQPTSAPPLPSSVLPASPVSRSLVPSVPQSTTSTSEKRSENVDTQKKDEKETHTVKKSTMGESKETKKDDKEKSNGSESKEVKKLDGSSGPESTHHQQQQQQKTAMRNEDENLKMKNEVKNGGSITKPRESVFRRIINVFSPSRSISASSASALMSRPAVESSSVLKSSVSPLILFSPNASSSASATSARKVSTSSSVPATVQANSMSRIAMSSSLAPMQAKSIPKTGSIISQPVALSSHSVRVSSAASPDPLKQQLHLASCQLRPPSSRILSAAGAGGKKGKGTGNRTEAQ